MTHPHIMRFLQLRKEGKIGPVWNYGAGYMLAEQCSIDQTALAQFTTQYISNENLEELVDRLSGFVTERKPVLREFGLIKRKLRGA